MKRTVVITVSAAALLFLFLSWNETVRRGGDGVSVIYRSLNSVGDLRDVELKCDSVVPVVYQNVISLEGLDIDERKDAFIRITLPSILTAKHKIKQKRAELLRINEKIGQGTRLSNKEITFLSRLFEKYRTDDINELLSRLNTHPPSIILAQAALESGWGTSRFFVDGNNIFGIWTFKENRGIKAVSSDARLSRYRSILESVEDYLYNINVGWAYSQFREMRTVTPHTLNLVSFLGSYAIIGDEYIDRLNTIIRSNNLEIYDKCRIDPRYIN